MLQCYGRVRPSSKALFEGVNRCPQPDFVFLAPTEFTHLWNRFWGSSRQTNPNAVLHYATPLFFSSLLQPAISVAFASRSDRAGNWGFQSKSCNFWGGQYSRRLVYLIVSPQLSAYAVSLFVLPVATELITGCRLVPTLAADATASLLAI